MAEPTMRGWWQDEAGKWHPPEDRQPVVAPPAPVARATAPTAAKPARRRLRPFTWAILAVNVLFLIWVISVPSSGSGNCAGLAGDTLKACQAGTNIGKAIGAGLIIFLWVAVDVILGVVWLVTNRRD